MSEASKEFIGMVKDIFLAEPLTKKGRTALLNISMGMTEDEFFDTIYVEPFSIYNKKNEIDTECVNIDSDVDQTSYKDIVDLKVLSVQKDEFERSIRNLNDALFIVKGVAGSGKTTYLYELIRSMSDDIDTHIYNFEEVRHSNAFMGTSFDLKKLYSNNVYKFLSIILLEISKVIGKGEKTQDEHYEFIKKISEIYINSFMVTEDKLKKLKLSETNVDIEEQQELFDLIHKFAEREINYNALSIELKEKFINRFNSEETDAISDLSFCVGFTVRLYYCVSKIIKKKQLFVVDNIETFLPSDKTHPIQQCELEGIIRGCYDAAVQVREILNPLQKTEDYDTFYGLLVVTRETTLSTVLSDLEHYNDFKRENEIDISEWFCTEEIYENKKKFCKCKGVKFEENCYFECYKNVLSDFSVYRWGLNGIISKMYKHSHRRNIECVPEAICVRPENEITYYNSLWKIIKEGETPISGLKAVCRKYILRILLDNVQRKQYFDKLMVENLDLDYKKRNLHERDYILSCKPHREDSNSYARKIATVLHRAAMNQGNDIYISFPRILKTVLETPYTAVGDLEISIIKFGKILFLMNETRNEMTNWTSLVCIKYDSSQEYSEANLCNILVEQWKAYLNNEINLDDTSKYGVKITEAGEFFAKILADFEYFACRFLSNEPPLCSLENLKPIFINGKRSFRAVEIINIVREKAFSCIDEIIERDCSFYANNTHSGCRGSKAYNFNKMYNDEYSWIYKDSVNAKAVVHPYRILTQHQGYLANYLDYISRFVPENYFEDELDKQKLLDMVKNQNASYSDKLADLLEKYPEYFRAEIDPGRYILERGTYNYV